MEDIEQKLDYLQLKFEEIKERWLGDLGTRVAYSEIESWSSIIKFRGNPNEDQRNRLAQLEKEIINYKKISSERLNLLREASKALNY